MQQFKTNYEVLEPDNMVGTDQSYLERFKMNQDNLGDHKNNT